MQKFEKKLNSGSTDIDYYIDGSDYISVRCYIDKDAKPPLLVFGNFSIYTKKDLLDVMDILKDYMDINKNDIIKSYSSFIQ